MIIHVVIASSAGREAPVPVYAHDLGGQLCVHRAWSPADGVSPDEWTVTHKPTGWAVYFGLPGESRRATVRAAWKRLRARAREQGTTIADLLGWCTLFVRAQMEDAG